MSGVRVLCFEHPPSVYELRGDRAALVSGRDLGPVDLHPNDALLVALRPGTYSAADGPAFLRAVWAAYSRGSRLRAERF